MKETQEGKPEALGKHKEEGSAHSTHSEIVPALKHELLHRQELSEAH